MPEKMNEGKVEEEAGPDFGTKSGLFGTNFTSRKDEKQGVNTNLRHRSKTRG